MSKNNNIQSAGSILIITKPTQESEQTAINNALNQKISSGERVLEDQRFATDGKAVFRIDSPGNKPTFEIQRNGPKAQGEKTTVACVCEIEGVQELLNAITEANSIQSDYNKVIWKKLKWSFDNKKNANITLADLKSITDRMKTHFSSI